MVPFVDVNVLVYAHRQDTPQHHEYVGWLNQILSSDQPLGYPILS
jgi:predicted nucleic acid-binding protein